MTPRPSLTASSLVAALALWGPSAAADVTKAQCIDANTHGQSLRRDHKLVEARAQFQACSDPGCPGIVASDCTKRLDELEAAQPTIVFDVKDGSGHDLAVVKVSVDNTLLTNTIDGSPVRVEPGSHVFTFEVAGQAPVTQTFIVKEGEKERHEKIVIGTAPAPSPSTTPTPAASGVIPPPLQSATSLSLPPSTGAESTPENPDIKKQTEGMGTQKILGLTAAGVGAAGLGVGGVFGLLTASAISKQKSDCPSAANCNYLQGASDHSTSTTDGTVSTIAFIAGGALVAGGLALFFTAHGGTAPAATGLVVLPSVGPGAGGMLLRGEF